MTYMYVKKLLRVVRRLMSWVTYITYLMHGTNCLSQQILDRYHCSCAVSDVWIYLATCIYNFSMYYVYNVFYVFDYIAHCWATFSALCALLSSHIVTNKDDEDDNNFMVIIKQQSLDK